MLGAQRREPPQGAKVITSSNLWGNASVVAAYQSWVRGFTNASIIIGVQKSGTTALDGVMRAVLGLHNKTHRKELHIFNNPHTLDHWRRRISGLAENGWFVDATPSTFQSLTAMLQFSVLLPHARFWLILRDPVDRCACDRSTPSPMPQSAHILTCCAPALSRAFSAWDQNRRAGSAVESRAFNVAVHQELRDLVLRCANISQRMLGSKKGINATGAARLASLLGAPLRVKRLHESTARRYTTLPACLQQSCWLRRIGPGDDAACKEYLIRGLVSKNLVAWRRHFGRRLTVLRLEDVFSNLTRTAHVLAAMVGVPRPTATWQKQALSGLLAKDGCFHHCKTAKANQTEHLHVMNAKTERKLVAFYAADQAALRRLEPSMRWPRFDTEGAAAWRRTPTAPEFELSPSFATKHAKKLNLKVRGGTVA